MWQKLNSFLKSSKFVYKIRKLFLFLFYNVNKEKMFTIRIEDWRDFVDFRDVWRFKYFGFDICTCTSVKNKITYIHEPLIELGNNYYLMIWSNFFRINLVSRLSTKWLFLHEISHYFRINTKPGLHKIAHLFEIHIFWHEIADKVLKYFVEYENK